MLQPFLQSEDPRQRFIPNAEGLDGELGSGSGNPVGIEGGWVLNVFDGDWWTWLFAATGLGAILSAIWSVYVVLAYLVSMLLLGLYVYASVRKAQCGELEEQAVRNSEALYDQYFRAGSQPSRLQQVEAHIESGNPTDWKLAIIEVDIILDEILKERGYAGTSLGERLRSVSPSQLPSLSDAWEAHKVRNQIAHEGADFILTERLAHETIQRYRRVFEEFGVR